MSASGKKDACILLTSAEVEAVQGEPVSETKTSAQPNGEMLITECVFRTTTFAKSVSLALARASRPSLPRSRRANSGRSNSTHPTWKRTKCAPRARGCRTPSLKVKKKRVNRGGLRGSVRTRTGWELRSRAPLYVLQGNNFVRISVGGVGEESVRIEKSKVLARAVVNASIHTKQVRA